MRLTLAARGPLGLSVTSNWTLSPSLRVRKPSARISEWWTKTSGPPSRERKPKPLDSLNHFTVPSIMNGRPPGLLPSRHVTCASTKTKGSQHGCPHPQHQTTPLMQRQYITERPCPSSPRKAFPPPPCR